MVRKITSKNTEITISTSAIPPAWRVVMPGPPSDQPPLLSSAGDAGATLIVMPFWLSNSRNLASRLLTAATAICRISAWLTRVSWAFWLITCWRISTSVRSEWLRCARTKSTATRTSGTAAPSTSRVLSAVRSAIWSALQVARGARRRPFGAALEPVGHFRDVRQVDARRPRPREDAGDVEVRDREMLAEQVGLVCHRGVEHHQRAAELAFA